MVDTPTQLPLLDLATPIDRADAPGPSAPLVTVALVAHNPGAWFEEVLRSLLAQDYPSLDVVVIDAASDEPVAGRVHDVIAEATVVPLLANQGFAKNANMILDHTTLGPYLLICHDDAALAPDCIRHLVEEMARSNAGIIGPKLLDWNDPSRILHVGLGADKTGMVSDLAEPGEYDQEQHDAVRDVFAVPGAVTLVRSDLFVALEGFDEAIVVHGEDLDLCWRAHALGARVMVNPEATARHREDLSTRVVGHDRDRFARRHRIRAMLSNYGTWHSIRVVPQALVASVVNATRALFHGQLALVVDIWAAWLWNLRRLPSIRQRRRKLARLRQVGDAEVRALQVGGFESLRLWQRNRADRRARVGVDDDAEAIELVSAERKRWFRVKIFVWCAVGAVMAFGSRELITGGLPAFNQFVPFPDGPGPLLTEWGSTWRSAGVGSEGPSSLLHALLGFAGIAAFGQTEFVRLLLTLGMLVVGAVGAYRMLTPFKSAPAQLMALVVYVTAPLPYNALYGGSWSGLVAYGAMPWIAKHLAVMAGIAPFGQGTGAPRSFLPLTMTVAAASLVEPLIGASIVVLVVGWVLGSLATRRVLGVGRLVVAGTLALVATLVFLLPEPYRYFADGADPAAVLGSGALQSRTYDLADLLRLATGPHGASLTGWALLVVPALALVLAFGNRLAWAARSWVVVVISVGMVWVIEQTSWLDVAVADRHALLAPAAMSLAFAAGMTAVAFERDLRRYRFGWRQMIPFAALVAMAVSIVAGLGGAIEGRWKVVEDGYEGVFAFFEEKAPAHARTFWIGDADVLPVNGWRYDERLSFSITPARTPTVLDYPVGGGSETVDQIRDVFDETLSGGSSRLGQRLGLYGIRYVVIVEGNAPDPFSTITDPVDAELANRLTEQLDLVRVEVRQGATIYENRAYVPTVSAFEAGSVGQFTEGEAPTAFTLSLPEVTSLRSYRGPLSPGELFLAAPSDTNWTLRVDGARVPSSAVFDWAQVFEVDRSGEGRLTHDNERIFQILSLAQLMVWIVGVTVLVLGRRRSS